MNKSTALNQLANFLAKGEYKSTIQLATKLLAENPDFARAYGFRGLANFELVINELSQIINNVTVKTLSLKNLKKNENPAILLKSIVADWDRIYLRMRSFTSDLSKALDLNERIYHDFDRKSTESFRQHWDEGIGEFLRGSLEIVANYDAKTVERNQKNLTALKKNIQRLFDKLDNPPSKFQNAVNSFTTTNASFAENVQVHDFGETFIDFDAYEQEQSGILSKSYHIVAYTMNSALEAEVKMTADDPSDTLIMSVDEPDDEIERSPVDEILKSLKPMTMPDESIPKLKRIEPETVDASVTLTDIDINTHIDTSPSEELAKALFPADMPKREYADEDVNTAGTLVDASLIKSIDYKTDEKLGKTHKLIRDVRYSFDNYCKNLPGHTLPNLNEILTPKYLTRRHLFLFEFQFLYQTRDLSVQNKIYQEETPGTTDFNVHEFDKWTYTKSRFNFRPGKFSKPVAESYKLVDCDKCQGEGKFGCPQCKGTGRIKCEKCDGMGAFPPTADKDTSPCPKCNGAGGIICPTCKKEGFVTCETCGGQKQVLQFLNIDINQESTRKFLDYPAKYYPKDADFTDLKKRSSKTVYDNEFVGLPDIEDIQELLPKELAGNVIKLFAKMKPEKSKTKLFATALKIHEIEILHFEYSAKIEADTEEKDFSADFVGEDFKVYPSNDPHLNHVYELRTKLRNSLARNDVRQSKRLIRYISTIVHNDKEALEAKEKIKRKARWDYNSAIMAVAAIVSFGIFLVTQQLNNRELEMAAGVLYIPACILTYFISLVLRSLFKTLFGKFFSRFIFLTIISTIIIVGLFIILVNINEKMVANFVDWCDENILKYLFD